MKKIWTLTLLLALLFGLPALADHEAPGCPPSNCGPIDPNDPTSTNRLTLFPGTTSVVHDNFPGDLDPTCGILRAANVPFPDHWVSTGSALFSGTIFLQPPDPALSLPGKLIVTDAVIFSSGGAGGAADEFQSTVIPLACGAFYLPNPLGPASLQVGISGTLEVDDDGVGSGELAGNEELNLIAVALKYTTTAPVPAPPPSALFVEVQGPNLPTPSPYPVANVSTSQGQYALGENIIGLKMGVLLPSGESFHLPNSIFTTFGEMSPPAVPNGIGGTAPMTVAKLDPLGTELLLSWDTESCEGESAGHMLIYGHGFPTSPAGEAYSPTGAVCGVDPEPFTWSDTPPVDPDTGLLWWLMLAEDGSLAEGSWGPDWTGAERNGPGPNGSSLQCGMETKNLANTCGQ